MVSRTSESFRKLLNGLPKNVQRQAHVAYARWEFDHYHPSLRFRQVHPSKPYFSARISDDYRAVGVVKDNRIVWFWIGSHSEYDNLLKRL